MSSLEKTPSFFLGLLIYSIIQQLERIAGIPSNPTPEKKSGYLTVLRISDGALLLLCAIGEIPPDKIRRYRKLSLEKAWRLWKLPDHISSFQSRDPGNNLWGGAIRAQAKDVIISFSGLRELTDEALVTVAGKLSWLLSEDEVQKIEAASQNPFIALLR